MLARSWWRLRSTKTKCTVQRRRTRAKWGCFSKVPKVDLFAKRAKDQRALLTPCCVTLAFVVATHYADPGFNISFLLLALTFLLIAYCCSLFRSESGQLTPQNLVCLYILAALLLHQFFITRSPDSSFVFALTMGAIPITVLIVQRSAGERILDWCFAVVLAMAAYSAIRYIGWQERAHSQ